MNQKYKGSKKQLLFIIILSSIIFALIAIVFTPKKEINQKTDSHNKISIKDTEHGFLYYDGDIYYKNQNLIIYDLSQVGKLIGKNEKHFKKDDVVEGKVEIDNENLCIYAEPIGTEVYSYKLRDDVLLIESDYALNKYFVYIKDKSFNELSDYYSLDFFINNPDKVDNYRLISYQMKEIDIDFSLSDFVHDENNTFSFYSSSIYDGAMKYYLLVKSDNLYSVFEGEGNLLSDIILLNSTENNKIIQYMYTHEGLKNILMDMYADYFEIDEEMKESLLNIQSEPKSIKENNNENIIEESTESFDADFEFDVITQEDLLPLK